MYFTLLLRWLRSGLGRRWVSLVAVSIAGALYLAGASSSATAAGKPVLTIGSALTACAPGTIAVSPFNLQFTGAYPELITYEGHQKFKPAFVTAWKVSRNLKQITLTLRPGVRFADGTPFTASAMKTWADWYEARPAALGNPTASGAPVLASVRVLSKYVVKFNFKTPDPFLVGFFSDEQGIFDVPFSPKEVAIMKKNQRSPVLGNTTDGLGPYVYDPKTSVVGSHCTFVPNKYYYDQSALKWSKVIIKYYGNNQTLLSAMETGQVEFGTGAAPTAQAAASAGLAVLTSPANDFTGWAFLDHGALVPALASVKVRQALNYAIDRKTIVRALFGKAGIPTSDPYPDVLAWDPKVDAAYPYDPAKAKALLAAAGYPKGFSMKVFPTAGDYALPTYQGNEIAEACVRYWKAIGVNAILDLPQNSTQDTNDLTGKTFSMVEYPAGSALYSPFYLLAVRSLSSGNYLGDQHGWDDTVFDRMAVQGMSSGAEGTAAYRRATRAAELRAVTNADFVTVAALKAVYYVNPKYLNPSSVKVKNDQQTNSILEWKPAK